MMATKVFISYRRDDSAGHAGRVHDRLEREFGRDLLFMDVDAVPLGVNFVTVLSEEVAKCDVLLAVIGPNWLNAHDEDGSRRLDNPHDFVRIEIGAALQRSIPVIPILLDGAKVPKANQLPKELEELSLRNGLDIRHASFHNDVDRLIRGLKEQLAEADAEKRRAGENESRQQKKTTAVCPVRRSPTARQDGRRVVGFAPLRPAEGRASPTTPGTANLAGEALSRTLRAEKSGLYLSRWHFLFRVLVILVLRRLYCGNQRD
jgi:hypothetical protein